MKIRSGFVSNSSSSSFVIRYTGFSKEPKTFEDFCVDLFSKFEPEIKEAYLYYNEDADFENAKARFFKELSVSPLKSEIVFRPGQKSINAYKHFDFTNHENESLLEFMIERFINHYRCVNCCYLGQNWLEDHQRMDWEAHYLDYNG